MNTGCRPLTGLMFAPLLIVCVAGLAVMPPPSAEDERLRVARAPMDGAGPARDVHGALRRG